MLGEMTKVNFYEQLEWSNWKLLQDQEKKMILQQVLMYFVNPLLEISDIRLQDFELAGIKCRTFSLEIAGERYILIPGQQQTILGWDLGAEGLRPHEVLDLPKDSADFFQLSALGESFLSRYPEEEDQYDWQTISGVSQYINDYTTPLRQVDIPPMLVAQYAIPGSCQYLGRFDTVTGNFTGAVDVYAPLEETIKQAVFPNLSPAESLSWAYPRQLLLKTAYLETIPETDAYYVFGYQPETHEELQKRLAKKGFDLLTEDEWEFAAGAGTRRLFRWGNELDFSASSERKQLAGKANMFGLHFATDLARYEVTDNPAHLKMGPASPKAPLIKQRLPLSTYYQSFSRLAETALDPTKHLVRKAIRIEP